MKQGPLEATGPTPGASARDEAIAAMASAEGERWAVAWFEALRHEGRAVAGGWPGTMSEARVRVTAPARALRLTGAELSVAARIAYDAARKAWAATAEPDDETERPVFKGREAR